MYRNSRTPVQEKKERAEPVVIWHSDPVGPDETVMVTGDGFTRDTVVELARLEDKQRGQPPAEAAAAAPHWTRVQPLQQSAQSLKFVIPGAWPPGVFACRIRCGTAASPPFYVNAPDTWWFQGDEGLEATPGGWLRVFGKCLSVAGSSAVYLYPQGEAAPPTVLKADKATSYALGFTLPPTLPVGAYAVWVHNGAGGRAAWRNAGTLRVRPPRPRAPVVVNVLNFGAQPNTDEDCTLPIVQGLEYLGGVGGGVLYFPRGRYRVNSHMRSGLLEIDSPLNIPSGITLRGEGMGLVSLWWPDRQEPLTTLIEGGSNFAIEDLAIYTQGRHRNIITGQSNVRIARVRIRAHCRYMCCPGQGRFGRQITEPESEMGRAIELWGDNVQVTDCDIWHSGGSLALKHVHGGVIARNTMQSGCNIAIYGGEGIVVEDNVIIGGVNGPSNFFGAKTCRHIYYALNRTSHIYGGDREAVTFDGHGTSYLGRIARVQGTTVVLAENPKWGMEHKDMIQDWHGTRLFILEGKGAGQYREIVKCDGSAIEIDRPWDVATDASSWATIGLYNGRHLFIGNVAMDTGTIIQLYPPNFECVVAENRGRRVGNFNSGGMLSTRMPWGGARVEPSWYNQFLDNVVEEGNGWGGGESVINGPIGGEVVFNVYGANVEAAFPIPISRAQVLRRNILKNNSSIRISGAVDNVLVEKCQVLNNERGIGIHAVCHEKVRPEDNVTAVAPTNILLRKNAFNNVRDPIIGDAASSASVEDQE